MRKAATTGTKVSAWWVLKGIHVLNGNFPYKVEYRPCELTRLHKVCVLKQTWELAILWLVTFSDKQCHWLKTIQYELNLTKTTLFREMLKMVTIWTKALQINKVMKLHPQFEWLNMSENCYWSCVNSSFSICCWLICKRCRLDMWTIVPLCLQDKQATCLAQFT